MCEWGHCIHKSVKLLFWKDNIYSVFTDIVIKATLNVQHLFVSHCSIKFNCILHTSVKMAGEKSQCKIPKKLLLLQMTPDCRCCLKNTIWNVNHKGGVHCDEWVFCCRRDWRTSQIANGIRKKENHNIKVSGGGKCKAWVKMGLFKHRSTSRSLWSLQLCVIILLNYNQSLLQCKTLNNFHSWKGGCSGHMQLFPSVFTTRWC